LLPAGAFAGWDLHPLESAAFSRRTQIVDIPSNAANRRIGRWRSGAGGARSSAARQGASPFVRICRFNVIELHNRQTQSLSLAIFVAGEPSACSASARPPEADGIINQGIVGFLDPIGQLARQEQRFLLRLGPVGHGLIDGRDGHIHDLAVVRPSYLRWDRPVSETSLSYRCLLD
jgi:hypothetical protein